MIRILLLFSGGLDSVTLATKLKREGHEVFGLFVDRGQSNLEREREAVAYFEQRLPIDVKCTSIRDWRDSWKRLDGVSDKELPRNAMFAFAALPFAREIDADAIALGCNTDDTAVPDGSMEFVHAVNQVLSVTQQRERLIAPFLDEKMGKAEVAHTALQLLGETDVAKTWTCWRGKVTPCRECPACRSRDNALKQASGLHAKPAAPIIKKV
ncbi:7-cyano-7-deazaguanine synthase [Bradyrhizobium sp. LA6.10]|uniref:7-cyano-7-deazaguanine synthase n=1 Tax=Bradyrhizobium sp. LA6.10 TaxID=3156318 RepID=UPI00339A2347